MPQALPAIGEEVPQTVQDLPPIGAEVPQAGGAMNFAVVNGKRVPVEAPRTWEDTAEDLAIGAAKGVGNTVYGLGKLVHDYTPIGRISDAIQPGAFESKNKPPELTPTNTPQKVGQGIEQVGEFFLPTGIAGKAAKAAEVAKSAALTLAQGGGPVSAGLSAGLTAALPGASAAGSLAGKLETSAQKEMAQALGATKEWAKVEAAKLAPQMLERGIGGSRPAMLDLAKTTAKRVGGELQKAYELAAQAGETVPANVIQGNIQLSGDALKVRDAKGILQVVPGTEQVVKTLDKLGDFVASMGPDIPVDKAAHIKKTWDQIVSKAGLFGPKALASATDNADAWATRQASGSFRELLNTNPTIADLNKEFGFWAGLRNVLKETEKRTQAQRGGLTDAIRGAGGAAAGAAAGMMHGGTIESVLGAAAGGYVTQQLSKLIASPAWKTVVSAPAKQALADALASGHAGQILNATSRMVSALPSQAGQYVASQ